MMRKQHEFTMTGSLASKGSSVGRQTPCLETDSQEVREFVEKVHQVNDAIEEQLNRLERQLETIRNQKQNRKISPALNMQDSPQRNRNPSQSSENHILKQSNATQVFPAEFITFLNTISEQIFLDAALTNLISTVEPTSIKPFINGNTTIDPSYFFVSSAEMDPLCSEDVSRKYVSCNQQLFQQIIEKYMRCQDYFRERLSHKIQANILELLMEELRRFKKESKTQRDDCLTIGQFVSYINMRTNTSFRNRNFVKLLRRMGLKYNSLLNRDCFYSSFAK